MATKRVAQMKVGAGIAAGIAGALAGAYLLYARTKPQQKKTKAWVVKARKDAAIAGEATCAYWRERIPPDCREVHEALWRDEQDRCRRSCGGCSRREIRMETYPDAGQESSETGRAAAASKKSDEEKSKKEKVRLHTSLFCREDAYDLCVLLFVPQCFYGAFFRGLPCGIDAECDTASR